jgi:hypothetical protein
MHEVAEGGYQVEGNPEVQALFRKWLKIAEEGQHCFAGVIVSKSTVDFRVDQAGVIGLEFAAITGCEHLKHQILAAVIQRMPPPIMFNAPANRVVFNIPAAPISFDFLAWLATCELIRIQEGAPPPLQVAFSFGADQNVARYLGTEARHLMFHKVMRPLISMIGGVEIVDLNPENLAQCRWPDTYTLKKAAQLVRGGLTLPPLEPSRKAVEEVEQFLGSRRSPVVITLREVEGRWPHRNSNLPEWFKFADWLTDEDVIFVRDTAFGNDPLGPYHTMPAASRDLNVRLALYQRAKCNLGVGNGPLTVAFHTKAPWLMMAPIDPSGAYPAGRPEWWLAHHGICPGEQFPWSAHNQRIVWELDTFENIRRAWCDLWDLPLEGVWNAKLNGGQHATP